VSLARGRLRQFLGHLPDSAPLEARVEERTELDGGLIRELVSYQVEPGERIRAYVFLPRGTSRTRAIWCIHQHAGQFDLGKSEPTGLAGNPQQHYALELARRGYVTMVADQLCFEERREPRLDGQLYERFEFTRRVSAGSTLQAKYSWDNWRGLDYLQGRSEVDPNRIGCLGHSLGGQQSLLLAALDERIKVGASSCGFASLATIFRDRVNHNYALYLPGLTLEADTGDILALAGPRPFFAGFGRTDRIFPIDGVEDTIARARPAFPEGHLEVMIEEGGHAFTDAMRERCYAFFDHHL